VVTWRQPKKGILRSRISKHSGIKCRLKFRRKGKVTEPKDIPSQPNPTQHQLPLDGIRTQSGAKGTRFCKGLALLLLIVLLCFCSHLIFYLLPEPFGRSFIYLRIPFWVFSVYLNLLTGLCLFLFSLEGCQQWTRYGPLHIPNLVICERQIVIRNRFRGSGNTKNKDA